MPPRRFSRHTFARGFRDPEDDAFMLEDPEPFPFRERADNRTHVVAEGDTLFSIAALAFPSYPRPDGFFWIIADYQPPPPRGIGVIIDPTRKLPVGATIFIPSERLLEEEIFNEARRREVADD